MDCGAACIATICRYYGKHVSLNRMRELSRVGRAGASMLNFLLAANTLGFETDPYLATYEHLMEHHLPAIINYQNALTNLDLALGTTLKTWKIEVKDEKESASAILKKLKPEE